MYDQTLCIRNVFLKFFKKNPGATTVKLLTHSLNYFKSDIVINSLNFRLRYTVETYRPAALSLYLLCLFEAISLNLEIIFGSIRH